MRTADRCAACTLWWFLRGHEMYPEPFRNRAPQTDGPTSRHKR